MSTNKLKFGTETPTKLYLGATEVTKAYMGETLVYEKSSPSGETLVYEKSSPSGETWLINEQPSLTELYVDIDFTSNAQDFIGLTVSSRYRQISYQPNEVIAYAGAKWTNQAYRTVTFAKPPTGDLLTWLQANATKQ